MRRLDDVLHSARGAGTRKTGTLAKQEGFCAGGIFFYGWNSISFIGLKQFVAYAQKLELKKSIELSKMI